MRFAGFTSSAPTNPVITVSLDTLIVSLVFPDFIKFFHIKSGGKLAIINKVPEASVLSKNLSALCFLPPQYSGGNVNFCQIGNVCASAPLYFYHIEITKLHTVSNGSINSDLLTAFAILAIPVKSRFPFI